MAMYIEREVVAPIELNEIGWMALETVQGIDSQEKITRDRLRSMTEEKFKQKGLEIKSTFGAKFNQAFRLMEKVGLIEPNKVHASQRLKELKSVTYGVTQLGRATLRVHQEGNL